MDFISNKQAQIASMLATLGIHNVEELFSAIPKDLLLPPPPATEEGLSEQEGMRLMEELSKKNLFPNYLNFIGAGAYEHHIPALVGAVIAKSEFLTSYTPYQAEASQGMLQLIFEFQSAICALTGLDVANASVYDGASACAEAVLMALRLNKGRKKVLIGESVHPNYRAVIETYLKSMVEQGEAILEWIPVNVQGATLIEALQPRLNEEVALLLLGYPSFFGPIDDLQQLFQAAHAAQAITIVSANPLVYGLYRSAKELGADIAVGDVQPLGIPLQFGGPYAGYFSCKEAFVRQLPGRLVGETVDTEGKRGFVLTLQTREQHIRREKATSNICTNQSLMALASLVAMLWYGPEGLQKLALTNFQRAAYLRQGLLQLPGVKPISADTHFNEFCIQVPDAESFLKKMEAKGIVAGLHLERYNPRFRNWLLIAATETKSKEDLDLTLAAAKEVLS